MDQHAEQIMQPVGPGAGDPVSRARDALSKLDLQLIHALQVDGRAPFSRLAAVLGVSDQTVHRRYRRLRELDVIRIIGRINAARLRREQWLIRLRCMPNAALRIAEALAERPDTAYVSLTSGSTEVVCITEPVLGQRTDSDTILLERLAHTPRVVSVSAHNVLHVFSGGPSGWAALSSALDAEQESMLRPAALVADVPPPVLDRTDLRLLELLRLDGRAGYEQLAQAVGCSKSVARRRVEGLRASGVLFIDVDTDPRAAGYRTQMMLWLSVHPAGIYATGCGLAAHHEVSYSAATTGSTNMVASVICRDADAFYRYLTTRVASLEWVRDVETAPLLRTVKRAGPGKSN